VELDYASTFGFGISGALFPLPVGQRLFFDNLQRVQGWIGGVRQDMLLRWVRGGQSHSPVCGIKGW